MRAASALLAALLLAFTPACGSSRAVTRTETDTTVDLSGRWNDTDARLVAEEMIPQCLDGGWLQEYKDAHEGEKPVVVVGKVTNMTTEQIDVNVFIEQMKNVFINARKVRFVSGGTERKQVREERMDQAQGHTSEDSAASIGNELGANFMLVGKISAVEDRAGGQSVIYYQTNLELHDMSTNEIVWNGMKKIKKDIKRDAYKA